MRSLQLAYGHTTLPVSLPKDGVVLLEARPGPSPAPEETLVSQALAEPCHMAPLPDSVHRGDKVAIVVSDITRPCPTSRLLPPLLEELARAGVRDADVRIVFALGSHRQHTPDEQARLVGPPVAQRFCCEDIRQGEFAEVGNTRRGTPVLVYRPVVEADWRVYLGNIDYHYFAGYTGGAKTLLPGVCSVESIQSNHCRMTDPRAAAGRIAGNPVREDIEEAATFLGPAFLLNVVLDAEKRVVAAVAGEVTAAHRQGCRQVDELYRVPLAAPADIVLASAGGWPKDINLYQAHKALENAARAVRDGGVVILVAECPDGIGHPRFAEWLTRGDTPQALLQRLQAQFVLGGHKAAGIAKILLRGVRVFLVSSLDAEWVRCAGFVPYASAQAALAAALVDGGPAAVLAVMPHAGAVLPAQPAS